MKLEKFIVKIDSRNRMTIPKQFNRMNSVFQIYEKNDGSFVLEPVKEIHEREQWMLDPKNKEILQRLTKSLQEKPTIDFDDFNYSPSIVDEKKLELYGLKFLPKKAK